MNFLHVMIAECGTNSACLLGWEEVVYLKHHMLLLPFVCVAGLFALWVIVRMCKAKK